MDKYIYLKEHKQAVIDSWLADEASQFTPALAHDLRVSMVGQLLDLLIDYHATENAAQLDLTAWGTVFHQRYQVSLAEMIGLIQSLRRYLIIGLSTQEALTFLLSMDQLIDPAVVQLTTHFQEMSATYLTERLREMEEITLELADNTEETDKALIQVQALYDVSRQMGGTLQVASIVDLAIDYLLQMTVAQSCVIWELDDIGLRATAVAGLDQPPPILTKENGGAIWHALSHKQTCFLTSEQSDPEDRYLLEQLAVTNMMIIPLAAQAILVGVVTLHSHDPRLASDIDLAQAIAQQLAMAWQNGQLFAEIRQLNSNLERRIASRTEELVREKELLETIYEITGHLTNTLDLDTLIRQTLSQTATAVGALDGLVMLNDDSYSSDLHCHTTLDGQITAINPHAAWLPICQWVITHRQTTLVDDLSQEDRWAVPHTPARSVVAAPIKADRDLHGVILLMQTSPQAFTTSHLRLVAVIATQLATAINNATLHGYVTEQVVRLGEMLHTQDVETGQKQAILSSIGDGVIASDREHRIILVNPAAESILEQPANQLIGQPIENILLNCSPTSERLMHKAIYEFKHDTVSNAPNGQELILEIGNRIINTRLAEASTPSDGKIIGNVIVLRDISKEVEADRAKTEFIATVSHELRTPMTSIRGYLYLMQQGAAGAITDRQKEFFNIINHNAERLTLLINDLLDISKIEAGRIKLDRQEAPLEHLAETVVKSMLIPAEEKGLALHLNANGNLPKVMIDRNRMSQVLTNLISNAINYTPQGSVTVVLREVAHAIEVSIADTGIGISLEDQKHIFERFYRSGDRVVQSSNGTGLGLAIVKSFIEMHDGRIWVNSTPGKGSTFTFILPTIPAEQTDADELPETEEALCHYVTPVKTRKASDVALREAVV